MRVADLSVAAAVLAGACVARTSLTLRRRHRAKTGEQRRCCSSARVCCFTVRCLPRLPVPHFLHCARAVDAVTTYRRFSPR